MILDFSDLEFGRLFNDANLFLPIRWDGLDFDLTLRELFDYYIKRVERFCEDPNHAFPCESVKTKDIEKVCGLIKQSVYHYLNGFPSKSYHSFKQVMNILMKTPLRVYQKSVMEQFQNFYEDNGEDDLKLFRVVCVNENRPYNRNRVFHTPYSMRSKVSTSRYSIAGYPSLYLGTSLELCCEEIHMNPHTDLALASMFKLERTIEYTNTNIQVIELAVKPQDFIEIDLDNQKSGRRIPEKLLKNCSTRTAYLLWYPLIAACSFIRTNRKDPFAAEYIIPQLLMQWVRSEISVNQTGEYDQLIGIRYFSCASLKASDMGFNYVFPTNGKQNTPGSLYCPVLTKAFRLTEPIYIHEHKNVDACEKKLKEFGVFDYIRNLH